MEMPAPVDKTGVRRFLGLMQYVAKFIPNLSTVSAPLRELTEKEVQFEFGQAQSDSFEKLKKLASTAPVLAFYDVNKPVTVSVDASSEGLGAVILQDELPVAYASKALTDSQKRYAQIEKEMLAICFGCERFRQYILAKEFMVETDHKPLENIFQKPLHQATHRIQAMMMKLQRFKLHVKYVPGKYLHVADALSRAYLKPSVEDTEEILYDETLEVNYLKNHVPMTEEKLTEFQNATCEDSSLQKLKFTALSGWPDSKCEVDSDILPYWNYRDEIGYMDGLLFKGKKLIVPKSLQREMLNKIHEPHLGIVKTKQRARDVLFWPGLMSQVEDTVSQCSVCNSHRPANVKEPMMSHDIPDRPWAKLGADLFELQGSNYLICVDYFSKFPEIAKLKDCTSKETITHMKSMFARHGIADEVMSDNGPCFASREFASFAKSWEFKHSTSSPGYPQSNGQAERTVQTVKNLIKKAVESGKDPYIALLEYRNAPLDNVGASPAQLLMSRRLKSKIPVTEALLQPEMQVNVHFKLKERQKVQKLYYDRGTKELPIVKEGEMIRTRKNGVWNPAMVSKVHSDRSYIVDTGGRLLRRNRHHIRSTKETSIQLPSSEVINNESNLDSYIPEPENLPYSVEPDNSVEHQAIPATSDNQVPITHNVSVGKIPRSTPGYSNYGSKTRVGRVSRLPARFRQD